MAKKEKDKQPETPPRPAPTTPATPVGAAPEVAPQPQPQPQPRPQPPAPRAASADDDDRGVVEQLGDTLVSTVQTVRGALPSSRVPVYLAGTALLVTGLIDPPVALGAGLAFEALRRWEPRTGR